MIEKETNNKVKYEKYFQNTEFIISLTGKDSHKVSLPPGYGGFTIGTIGLSKEKYDVMVNKDDSINWNSFNKFYTPDGRKNETKYPYGNWPRFFTYSGNDTGFIEWSSKREIENFDWHPKADINVDFTSAKIHSLTIKNDNYKIEFTLGENITELKLCGNLDKYKFTECKKISSLELEPSFDVNIKMYQLPVLEELEGLEKIKIWSSALSPAFDCNSLLQFKDIKELYLIGNMTNLPALKELKNLEKIGIWEMPDLSGMPSLSSWENLNDFVAVNVDEVGGKKLRLELSKLKKIKDFEYSRICQLRSPLWFETEYGIPFTDWGEKKGRKATSAYKNCLKRVKGANAELEVKQAIEDFVLVINSLEDIETIEANDTYEAISIIMKNSSVKVADEKWQKWFDDIREF